MPHDEVKDTFPFISHQAELIYYLTQFTGRDRSSLLGINESHYRNKKMAARWYETILPLVAGHEAARRTVEELYTVMTDLAEEDYPLPANPTAL